jgi:hypothetical protein
MEKDIVRYSYWLGAASMVLAFVWRGLNVFGLKGTVMTITYMTLYKGALLFFLTAIATTSYAWLKSQKP